MVTFAIDDPCPRLRPVEAFPATVENRKVICLRDQEGLATGVVTLPPAAFFIAGHLDGRNTFRDIQAAYFREFGQILYRETVMELLESLDRNYFLESDYFAAYRRRQEEEFQVAAVRRAAHAGTAYESDPERLRRQIDGFFSDPEGIGEIHLLPEIEDLAGLVAPHIDFQRGGPVYSWAYGALRSARHFDLFVVLGTSHVPLPYPFCVCLKDFETPLGVAPVDRSFGERLLKDLPLNYQKGVWAHRQEHSIEFQAVFLKYLFPHPDAFRILPVLCGPVPAEGNTIEEKHQRLYLDEFLDRLLELTRQSQRRVCFIAGADLAHMGPRFGDRLPVDDALLGELRAADRSLLQQAEEIDAEGFSGRIAGCGDPYRICGHSPIYALLRVCGARQGKLLRYGQAVAPDRSQVVTYASMAFYGTKEPIDEPL